MEKELNMFDWSMMINQKISCSDDSGERRGVLKRIEETQTGKIVLMIKYTEMNPGAFYYANENICKPILRTLDQITEEEHKHYDSCKDRVSMAGHLISPAEDYQVIDWLTQKGFDVRCWIEQGLAIKEGEE